MCVLRLMLFYWWDTISSLCCFCFATQCFYWCWWFIEIIMNLFNQKILFCHDTLKTNLWYQNLYISVTLPVPCGEFLKLIPLLSCILYLADLILNSQVCLSLFCSDIVLAIIVGIDFKIKCRYNYCFCNFMTLLNIGQLLFKFLVSCIVMTVYKCVVLILWSYDLNEIK